MSTVPAGKRSWKCPECGCELLLSVAQLDPIACDTCLKKMKGDGISTVTPSIANAAAGPLGIWSSLPDTTKLGIAVAALIVGVVIGFLAGSNASPSLPAVNHARTHSKEPDSTVEANPRDDSAAEQDTETRPDPPGPGYKWVRGRKHKDGTYGKGHWAKDPRAEDAKGSK